LDWGSVIWILLIVLGAACLVGGIVLWRVARTPGGKVGGAALAAAGLAMLAIVLFITPVSRSTSYQKFPAVERTFSAIQAPYETPLQM
jgi:hypothetical protein